MDHVSILTVFFVSSLYITSGFMIDKGNVICHDTGKCEIVCDYGFIPSGSFIVDSENVEGIV